MSFDVDLARALNPALLAKAIGLGLDPWQAERLRSRSARQIWNIGRQGGKSTMAALIAVHSALYNAGSTTLALSPSQRQSSELLRKCAGIYQQLGRPVEVTSEGALSLQLENASRIISLPGSEATIRGYTASLLLVDEAARIKDEVMVAISPMIAISKGRTILMSTPNGKRGIFYETWISSEPWERVHVTAAENPRISADFLASERLALGDRMYEQEYEGVFREHSAQAFSDQAIDGAFNRGIQPYAGEGWI